MQKKRIKFWIIFGCIFVSIPLICIVLSMSMKLKTVNVEFRSKLSEHTMLTDDIQSNIKNYFTLGESVALLNTEPIENKIAAKVLFVAFSALNCSTTFAKEVPSSFNFASTSFATFSLVIAFRPIALMSKSLF